PFPARGDGLETVRPVCGLSQLAAVDSARLLEKPEQPSGVYSQFAGGAFHRFGGAGAELLGTEPFVVGEIEPLGGVLQGLVEAAVEPRLADFPGGEAVFERPVDHVPDAAEVVANLVDLADDVVDELQILVVVRGEVKRGDVPRLAVAVDSAVPLFQ